MRSVVLSFLLVLFLISCNDRKVYQEYVDFEKRYWLVSDTVRFQFAIKDTSSRYNLFCNLRNSTHYPFSRVFLNVQMKDTLGTDLHKTLLNDFLFDPKTGKPFGKTGLGDLYDHQMVILSNYKFSKPGEFAMEFGQMMRKDTLPGVLSVGLGIERVE